MSQSDDGVNIVYIFDLLIGWSGGWWAFIAAGAAAQRTAVRLPREQWERGDGRAESGQGANQQDIQGAAEDKHGDQF